ncbi:MAG TPA: CoA-binding protein [Thermoanaerobaculia bacterium]|nr:CoA-binding protein [Thermoanaerobaculia bacterium]
MSGTATKPETTRTIAVIAASSDRGKYGNKCVRAYQRAGYRVFPVNLTEDEVEGEPVARSVTEVPADLDLIALYLPPPRTVGVLPAIAEKGAAEGVFFNPGSWDAAVIAEAERLGVLARRECAIIAAGYSPAEFPG